ncbi:MAG: hypothetical protein KC441_20405 [Anaerolineales bacterium]|nr:hypothetical protein [Anaerolineales bacterium]
MVLKSMRRALLFCVLVWVTAVPLTTQAQSTPITISQNEIEPSFPETIRFRARVEAETAVERVTLRYGTNGRSCQSSGSLQNITFEKGETVEAEWEWELRRSGAIPPGAMVWWQWEVEDADGHTLISDRQEYVVVDSAHTWQTLAAEGLTVSWYRGDETFGQAMLDQSQRSLAYLQDDLGLPQPEMVQLWFYDSASAVRDALVNVPEWTGGVAFPEYGITVLGVAPGEETWAGEIIPHELTHLLEGILTFNCRGVRLPTWLSEGLARHAEGEASAAEVDRLLMALAAGSLPPLKSLASGFSAYSDGAGLAYTQSGQVVAYLVNRDGPEKMTALLQLMQSGENVDAALTAVYGLDTVGLDADWRTSLGYAPTPTSAADAAASALTATPVPTIALGGIPQAATAVPGPAPSQTPAPTSTAVPSPTNTPVSSSSPQAIVAAQTFTNTPVPTPAVVSSTDPSSGSIVWFWSLGGLLAAAALIFIVLRFVKSRG